MNQQRFTRRGFLKATGMAGAGLALAACAPVASPAPESSSDAAAPAGESMTITIWGWWEERMNIFENAGAAYTEENPNVNVVVETFSDEIWTKIYAAVPAGAGPTLCKMQTTNYFKMRDEGLLIPLAEDIFPGVNLRETYPDHGWDQYGFYCVPEGGQPAVFTYNKRLFGEAGLDPETPPRTWDEFIDAAQKLTIRDDNGVISQAGFQYDDWLPVLNPLYQLDGMIVKRDGDSITANFNSPEMERAYQFFIDLAREHQVWDPNFPYVSDAIGNTLAAMSIGEAWVHGVYRTDFPDTFAELGFAAPPTPTGDADPYYGRKNAVLGLALLNNRPQAESDAGLKFLEYLVVERLDTQFDLASISGLVPAHVELMNGPQVQEDAFLTLGSQLLPQEYDTIEVSGVLNQLVADVMNRMLLENEPLASALEFGQSELQKLIDAGDVKHIY